MITNSKIRIKANRKQTIRLGLIGYLIIVFAGNIVATPSFVVRQIAAEDELAHAWVTKLDQDFLGFMWIGTSDGLYRYDGYNLKAYRSISGDSLTLVGNNITAIFQDSRKNLWVGSTRGLNKYDRNFDRFISQKNWPKVNISDIMEGDDGKIYFGTYEGLHIYDIDADSTELYYQYYNPSDPYDEIQPLCQFSKTEILLNGPEGLDIFNVRTKKFTPRFFFSDRKEWRAVNGFIKDYRGTIWISSREYGLQYISAEGEIQSLKLPKEHFLNNGTTLSLLESRDSILWVGTENHGISLIDLKKFYQRELSIVHLTGTHLETDLVNNSIYSLFEDQQGNIWIGTYGGLNLYNPVFSNFKHVRKVLDEGSLSNNNVTSFFENDGKIWIGTEGGINIYDPATQKFSSVRNITGANTKLSSTAVYSFARSSDGSIWIGTWEGGVNHYLPKSGEIEYFRSTLQNKPTINNDYIFSLTSDEHNEVWIATMGGGLNRYNPESREFKYYINESYGPHDIENNWVRQVFLDSKERLWISTYRSLSIMDRKSETFRHFYPEDHNPKSISDAGVVVIFEDSRRQMWFGTQTGLNFFVEEDSTFSVITTAEGLPSNVINAILEDDTGNLWLSTNNGITKFEEGISLPKSPRFTTFDMKDGLQGNKFNERSALKASDGTLYFGGKNGYNSFQPAEIIQNSVVPPVVITEFLVFNKQEIFPGEEGVLLKEHISVSDEIKLKYNYRVFTINFAALNYIVPEKNQYQYKLEGFEDEWNQVGTRKSATYTNLDQGEYIFRVIASNNSGVWNTEGTQLKIKILPPWYRTIWAYLAYLIIISGIVLSYRRFILIRSHLQHELVLQRVEKEKLDQVNKVKTRFFTNISHEFRTPLTLILSPLDSLLSDINIKPKISQQLAVIQKNARRLLRLINQVLDISQIEADHLKLKVGKGEVIRYAKEIASLFRWLSSQKNIIYTITARKDGYQGYFDGDKIEKISYNLIANAFKYTPEGGKIDVILDIVELPDKNNQMYLNIKVADSGVGIKEQDRVRIFDHFYRSDDAGTKNRAGSGIGLALVNGLVNVYRGFIEVNTELNQGTEFSVFLPVLKAAFKPEEIIETDIFDNPPTLDIYDLEQGLPEIQKETSSLSGLDIKNKKKGILLIVEDNPDMRHHLIRLFEDDYDILQAENGQLGLDICNEQIPDLVISDVKMPVLDGIEFCSKLKKAQNTSHIPIVLLTAKAANEDKLEGVTTGADAYLTKPFDNQLLIATVKNLIELRLQLKDKFTRSVSLEPSEITITSVDEKFLKKAIEIVDRNIANPEYSVDTFSKDIGMSRSHLHRKFVGLTGHSPSSFIRTLRMKRAALLLTKGQLTVSEILYEVGIKSRSYFTKSFKEQFGCSPTDFVAQYKSDNKNPEIEI